MGSGAGERLKDKWGRGSSQARRMGLKAAGACGGGPRASGTEQGVGGSDRTCT
jgi:hypothetical protein